MAGNSRQIDIIGKIGTFAAAATVTVSRFPAGAMTVEQVAGDLAGRHGPTPPRACRRRTPPR